MTCPQTDSAYSVVAAEPLHGMTIFHGKLRPNPSTGDVQSGVDEMIAALKDAGWSEGDYTIVINLGDKINVGGLAGVVPHVTINKSSIKAVVTKMLRNRVQ